MCDYANCWILKSRMDVDQFEARKVYLAKFKSDKANAEKTDYLKEVSEIKEEIYGSDTPIWNDGISGSIR